MLDAGPLSLVTHPKGGPNAEAAKECAGNLANNRATPARSEDWHNASVR